MAGEAKDNVIFKFTGDAGSYTLKINNGTKDVYTETATVTGNGGHCFYITTNPLTANVSGTLEETWASPATKAPAGTYSFSITGATSGVVLKGVFTIA